MDAQSGFSLPMSRPLPDSTTFPGNVLHIANHPVCDLVQKFGTPLSIYDRETIVHACDSYIGAFQEFYRASTFAILYASKAYLSPLIAQLIAQKGIGLDVVSGGELMVAQLAKFFDGTNSISWAQQI